MLFFIVNPSSSSRKGMQIWEETEALLLERDAEYECILLHAPGDARHAAGKLCALKKAVTAVIVGGDGTINEFLQGLTSFDHITFAFIPTGSGNDFARGLHLPSDPRDAVDMILDGSHVRNINIGLVTTDEGERSFAVSSGIGFDAAVCYESRQSQTKQLLNHMKQGKMIYTVNALRLILGMKQQSARLLLDGKKLISFDKVWFIAAMNTRYEGGGYMFAPKASPVDDKLDVFVAEGIPRWKIPFLLPLAYRGKHTGFKGVHIYRCSKAMVQYQEKACIHADGEHAGFSRKVTFSLRAKRLRTIVD